MFILVSKKEPRRYLFFHSFHSQLRSSKLKTIFCAHLFILFLWRPKNDSQVLSHLRILIVGTQEVWDEAQRKIYNNRIMMLVQTIFQLRKKSTYVLFYLWGIIDFYSFCSYEWLYVNIKSIIALAPETFLFTSSIRPFTSRSNSISKERFFPTTW